MKMLIVLQFLSITSLFGQLSTSFSGELIYSIEKIDANSLQSSFGNENSNTEEKLIIYAKDSLIKRVHFNSENGIQESIEHLSYGKKILLLSIDSVHYAVQVPTEKTNDEKHLDSTYKLSNKCFPKVRFAGLKGKPMLLSHPMLNNDLHIWFNKSIPPKYNAVYDQLPGLPLKYYVISEKGLYLYELESLKKYDPPLSIFQIPLNTVILSLKEFIDLLENQE
tara:strand:+ start:4719 stop:5384 length:666 start_codon:yes stop_codon:yes gene_type:complete